MRRITTLLAAVGAMLVLYAGAVLAQPPTPQQTIPDQYIVVLNDNAANPGRVANQHAQQQGAQVGFVYRNAIKGYSAVIPQNRLGAIENDPRVDYVEPDGVARVVRPPWEREDSTDTPGGQALPWGIDKIDADQSSTVAGDGKGSIANVSAYILDTGIDQGHVDLNVVNHVNFAGGPNKDCHGHGTHVAGTVAAKDNTQDVVGVAPGAPLTGVKVLGCSGVGSWSGIIAGIDWVTANAEEPAITNMSLGGGANQAVDDAVVNSANSGIFYSIAAGNDGADACNYSPARAGTHNGVATTAATDDKDAETSWSNYGNCVDIWAPGASILSTKSGGGTTTMSGTSMAAPHMGGGGALYLSSNTGASPGTVEAALKDAAATPDPATYSKDGRAILLEYVGTF